MTAIATDFNGGRMPRWVIPLLFGSLALNLAVIGAAGSLLWRGHLDGAEAPLGRRVAPNVVGYAVTLPPERVQELKRLTKDEWQRVQPLRRSLIEARDEVAKVLAGEPFDRERFLAAQARMLEADQRSRQAVFKLHTALSVSLTPDERRDFLRWREQQRQRRPQNPLDAPPDTPPGGAGESQPPR
jgi:uncharacterized membrane protein